MRNPFRRRPKPEVPAPTPAPEIKKAPEKPHSTEHPARAHESKGKPDTHRGSQSRGQAQRGSGSHRGNHPSRGQQPSQGSNPSRGGQNQHRGGQGSQQGGQNRGQRSGPPASRPGLTEDKRPAGSTIEGVLQRKGKVGFVLSEEKGVPDVLVQGASLKLAMGGDRVRIRLQASAPGARRVGEITEVITRSRQTFLGVFRRENGDAMLMSEEDDTLVRLTDLQGLNPREGDAAVARVVQWPTPGRPASGVLAEVIGSRSEPGVDLRILIRKHELFDEFPAAADAEAKAFGTDVPESAWKDREVLFEKRVCTIDGADAKDFDDAVSLERAQNGNWLLGVHIADVSHYVKAGGIIDEEAYKRGTSVYLSGNVLPMLPFPLADNLCSLRPNVPRLTLSCEMEIASDGNVVGHRVFESVIRSCKRFTYEEVEAVVKGEAPEGLDSALIADVLEMDKVARLVRKLRFERGSLDFDFPEPYIVTDIKGRPVDIKKRARLSSHRLIEDFMILANETVATHMRSLPFLYRVHEKPDLAKMERLQRTLEAVGIPVPAGMESGEPGILQKLLKSTEGQPVQPIVHTMVLRSLKQAVYSEINAGHFGLGSRCYSHFTSPIRRYPDLTVHRLLRESIQGKLTPERQRVWTSQLPKICRECSVRERLATDAEREFIDIQRVRFMESKVGEEFAGVVSSVTSFGLFVQPNDFFVEGLVRLADLDDYYVFDEARLMAVGKRTGKVFKIGTPVRVKLAGANPLNRQIDFQLLDASGAGPSGGSRPGGSRSPQKNPGRGRGGRGRR